MEVTLRRSAPALVALAVLTAPAAAKDKPLEQPQVFQAVIDCKALSDPAARLACYDRAVATLASAAEAKDVLVVDRKTVRETKRGLFGLTLPKIKLFGGNDDEEVTQIESTISAVHSAKDGMSVFVLADGGRWKQTDGRFLFPKVGQPILIRKGALGSFIAQVNKQPGVKVIRLQGPSEGS